MSTEKKERKVTGGIKIITGPMFSGKSSMMMRLVIRFEYQGVKTLVLKPKIDKRYSSTHVVSHQDLRGNVNKIEAVEVTKLSEAEEIEGFEDVDVIGIDEAGFFDEDIIHFCNKWHREGRYLIITGLNGSYMRTHFGYFHLLLPMCTDIVMLKAVCNRCKEDAHYTHRIANSKEKILVGKEDDYESLCPPCFFAATEKT
jgi:thymidine kinase